MKNQQIAIDVLELVGGNENIRNVTHCATRLRFRLKDEDVVKKDELDKHPEVIKVVQAGGQYQVVIGVHVSEVYKELLKIVPSTQADDSDDVEKEKVFNQLISIISKIFTPFLGVLAGSGVLTGFLNLTIAMGWLAEDQGAFQILNSAAGAFLTFLPIALAITAARAFKTNEFLAAALAMSLVSPDIMFFATEYGLNDFFGIPVIFEPAIGGYFSTVIPIIMAVYVQGFVERFFIKKMPRLISIFAVSMFTLLIMTPLTFIVIGPLGLVISQVIGALFAILLDFSEIFAGFAIGGLWQVAVMFGIHWGIVPLIIENLGNYGYDAITPLLAPTVMAQAGAAFAVFFLTKDVKLKGLAASGTITSLFGLTEPTIYGVTLPLKKPFVAASIAAAIAGAINGALGTVTFGFGGTSIIGFTHFIDPVHGIGSNLIGAVIAASTAFVLAFILTIIIGIKSKEGKSNSDVVTPVATLTDEDEIIVSPLEGNIVQLADVEDVAFSTGALGKGIAIEPTVGKLYAPADGVVTVMFPTGHAAGLTTDTGVEILMHIGLDTVELNGEHFTIHANQGDKVKKGDLLVEFDIQAIKAAGKVVTTPIVITNTANYKEIEITGDGSVISGDNLLTVVI